MEGKGVFAGLGILAAFGCGLALGVSCLSYLRVKPDYVAWRLRNGVRWAKPLSRVLLRRQCFSRLAQEAAWSMQAHGVQTTKEALISLFIAVVPVLVCAVGFISGSLVCVVAVFACLLAALVARLHYVRDKHREAMREAIPDVLRSMEACFQAGLSLLQTFQHMSKETNGLLQVMFARSAHQMETGCSVREALAILRDSSEVPELSFIVVALDVQHQSGGSMRKVLDIARSAVENKLELKRSLRVQTAQAKLSAQVISVMPFVLIAVFSLIDSSFLMPFFSNPFGFVLLGLAIGMQMMGVFAVRRLLAVDVDS